MTEFRMPSLGADMEAGTLCDWLVKPGDAVKRGDVIATVDTQKGLIDIEVFDDGIIDQIVIGENEKVPVGTLLALIRTDHEAPQHMTSPTPEQIKTEAAKTTEIQNQTPIKTPAKGTVVHIKASPLAKRKAAEMGIDLSAIQGMGEGGAITVADVENAAAQKTKAPKAKGAASSESIRNAVAAAMSKSNREIPHYYLSTRIDIHKALDWLAETNRQRPVQQRMLPVVLFIKAVAKAATAVPQLNGYWENGLQLKTDINIGFIVSLHTGGVMIPALHQADKRSCAEIMEWLNEIIPRARALNLRSSDLIDSTITITNLGEGNTEEVLGVIYPPQVALVGFGSIKEQPWAENGLLGVKPVITVTLAADHRATDGQIGSRFLSFLNQHLQNPETL